MTIQLQLPEVARQQAAVRRLIERSPGLQQQIRKARRKMIADKNRATIVSGKKGAKKMLLAEIRRVSGTPTLTWKAALKWLRKNRHRLEGA